MENSLSPKMVIAGIVSLTMLAILAAYSLGVGAKIAGASAPSGLPATLATTSNPVVTTSPGVVVASTTACTARIITTASSSVMLGFRDSMTPTASFGHYQAASTTVAYDSGLYGCGSIQVYSFGSQVITVSETR